MLETITENTQRQIFSVSALNQAARLLLEGNFPALWVEGEISNLAQPSSGHWYFSLKDSQAQIRCAMFRMRNQLLKFPVQDGMTVVVRGKVSLYEGRGDFQLLVEHMEEAGAGALYRAFVALKQRLQELGLFDPARKRRLPTIPQHIGVITSPTGAAIRDVLSVLLRRFPAIPITIYATEVQGKQAAPSIVRAIALANQHQQCDVLLITRGGGSLEDLWGFNEEQVALAIANSKIPTISGVGHEVDTTIADFVADQRAATPSAAAELLVPDMAALLLQLDKSQRHLVLLIQQRLFLLGAQLQQLRAKLQHPSARLAQQAQRLDNLGWQLTHAIRQHLQRQQQQWLALFTRLRQCNPAFSLQTYHLTLQHTTVRLHAGVQQLLHQKQYAWRLVSQQLDTISPLATLHRGYAITTTSDGKILHDADDAIIGSSITVRLAKGQVQATVQKNTP